MRKAVLFLSTALLAACAADAQEGGGSSVSRTFEVGSFSSVSLAGPHNVVVQVGPAASVRAEGPEKEIERLKIEVRGGDLEIGTKKESWNVGFKRDRRPVTIYVTTPSLAAADIAGSGDMRIDRVEGERFAAETAGSGNIEIAALRVSQADFAIAGSGNIKAHATRSADVDIMGSGDVEVTGGAKCSVSKAGSGDVRCM